jgi:hypothetical protein
LWILVFREYCLSGKCEQEFLTHVPKRISLNSEQLRNMQRREEKPRQAELETADRFLVNVERWFVEDPQLGFIIVVRRDTSIIPSIGKLIIKT